MICELANNHKGRDFVIGDLHGEITALRSLLNAVNFNPSTDRLIATGDLIDRGQHNVACLRLLNCSWFYSVRGNHEQFLCDYVKLSKKNRLKAKQYREMWQSQGGAWFFNQTPLTQHTCYQSVCQLPLVINVAHQNYHYLILHGEISPEINDANQFLTQLRLGNEQIIDACLWGRSRFSHRNDNHPINGIDYVLCGHTPCSQSTMYYQNIVNLDFAAFLMEQKTHYPAALCMYELGKNHFYMRNKTRLRQFCLVDFIHH